MFTKIRGAVTNPRTAICGNSFGDKKGSRNARHNASVKIELSKNIILSGKDSFLIFSFISFLGQIVDLFRID